MSGEHEGISLVSLSVLSLVSLAASLGADGYMFPQVQEKMEALLGIPADVQRLIFFGKTLSADR